MTNGGQTNDGLAVLFTVLSLLIALAVVLVSRWLEKMSRKKIFLRFNILFLCLYIVAAIIIWAIRSAHLPPATFG
jgi:ATP/ADP translocase